MPGVVSLSILLSLSAELAARPNSSSVGLSVRSASLPPDLSFALRKRPSVLCLHGYVRGNSPILLNQVYQVVDIDSPNAYVIVREVVAGGEIRPPVALTLDEYQSMMVEEHMRRYWREENIRLLTQEGREQARAGALNLDIPVKIKSKAFQKIFGGDKVGLSVSGDIRIQAGVRNEDRSEVRSAITRGSNTNFKMQQTQRFTVTGRIGDKVTVNVDQDSERAFEFENNVRINYQGYEDEIIRRIEAGNISLSLPGTRYVTFSGRNTGLFGVKAEMVLGNLNVTTIASQEKGESQRITLTGGAEEGARKLKIYPYLRNTYFFLGKSYRENYKQFDAQGIHIAVPENQRIVDIEVYKAAAGYETQFPDENIRGWATYNATPADTVQGPRRGFAERGFFIRIEKDQYFFEPNLGFIRMNNRVADNEILAVTYVTAGGDTVGGFFDNVAVFKLIKAENPQPSDSTWALEWKHVYSLGARNIPQEGFDLKIFARISGQPDQETDALGNKWVTVFGLDNKDQDGNLNNPDGVIDTDGTVVDFFNGELHFPDLQPFDPEGYFLAGKLVKPDLGEKRAPALYTSIIPSEINQVDDNFVLEVTTKTRSTNFNLGFNVIEGSEVVVLDGEELKKDRDYTIDYFTGTLTILDERASNPSSNLEISFERNQLFQLEKKTILGMRAEYDLGKDSFIGGTLLYLNESTLENKVRVGRGPIRNLVWDINTRLNFRPNFIGKALDFLPLLRAKGETTLNLEGEIAQVLPTPNTLNSPKTKDFQGVAYIDDFEGAKKTVSLGVLRRNWVKASAPLEDGRTVGNMMSFVWYNPFLQVPIKDIYPERDLNPNVPNRQHVLEFLFFPDPTMHNEKSWGGVMRALSPGLFDQSQSKFIEVMVKGFTGTVHIDLGVISEDVIPNGVLDTEDKRVGGIRNNILDPGEDVGIDGVARPDPPYFNFPNTEFVGKHKDQVPYDFWDWHNPDTLDADEPWSYDDWFYTETEPLVYFRQDLTGADSSSSINGTEQNANDEGGRRPDTEDINANGVLDRFNSYFSYSFSLDSTSADTALVVGGNPSKGWRLFRIPFIVENPEFWRGDGRPLPTQIEFARIWVDSLDLNQSQVRIQIAAIDLVGSDWKEVGSTQDEFGPLDGLTDTTVVITQINTFDDPEYEKTLKDIGVEGQRDKVTGVRAREQSIVLKAFGLEAARNGTGRNAGLAQKNLFQIENYIYYERIKMFVYGNPEFQSNDPHIPDSTSERSYLEYFFRFGLDRNNYYEYRSTIYRGWNPHNHMDVALQEFTTLDRNDTTSVFYDPATDTYVKYLNEDSTKSVRVKGNPSLTNVKMLILGLKNLHPTLDFNGEVWFNELRLSDVERRRGMAMRVRANLKIGNFGSVNAEFERRDADFRNVAQRFGTGNNTLSKSFNGTFNLENFLPQSWGLAIPVSVNYRQSRALPKYFPGRDRLVTGKEPDSLLATVRNLRSQNGFTISFRRREKSDNFFLKNTLDGLSFKLGRTKSHLENPTKLFSDVESWTGNLDYRLEFGRDNYIRLLSWLPGLPLIKKLKDTKFYYTPQNISARIAGSRSLQTSQDRNQSAEQAINKETYTVDRSVRANMKVFESLTVDFSRAHKGDMRGKKLTDIFSTKVQDINVAQNFNVRYTPRVFEWLGTGFNYSTNFTFNNNLQQKNTGKSARVNRNLSADVTFRWKQLVQSIFGKSRSRGVPRRRGRPGNRGRSRPGESQDENRFMYFQEKKGEGGGLSFNPLKLVAGFFSSFKDISFSYAQRKDNSQLGLTKFPTLDYQFGFTDTTGVASDSTLSTFPISRTTNNTYRINSGLAFGRAFDVSLSYQLSNRHNISAQTTGSETQSWLRVGNFDMPFPEWNVRISGLEKLPLFSKLFRSVSFSHAFSGQRDIIWNGTPENETQRSFTTNFRPLGKLDLNFRNGFTANIQMNRSMTLAKNNVGGSLGSRRTTRGDISVTANYSKQSGFRVPFWPFNKAELKNSINFTFTFTKSSVITEIGTRETQGAEETFTESERTDRWSFSPRLTYSFSNRVNGGAYIEIGQTDSKRLGKTAVKEFGIDVNIAIRGN